MQACSWHLFNLVCVWEGSWVSSIRLLWACFKQRWAFGESFSPWREVGQWQALFNPSPKKIKAFFPHASCTARTWASSLWVRGFASNFSYSANQESWRKAETNRRLGIAVAPAMGIRVILVSPSEDSSEKSNQSFDFRTLRHSHMLCKWEARQPAEFRQEPRRSTTDFYQCFLRTGRPPKTANMRDSGLFCLLLLLERPF